uniref:Zinc transporter ZIP11 n=1 Tax=Cyanistes caeruleus TaxID=156563 RepID=A0A8C0V944_CYACU
MTRLESQAVQLSCFSWGSTKAEFQLQGMRRLRGCCEARRGIWSSFFAALLLPPGVARAWSSRSGGIRITQQKKHLRLSRLSHIHQRQIIPTNSQRAACFLSPDKAENGEPYQRRRGVGSPLAEDPPAFPAPRDGAALAGSSSWRRITLMILAITIHNIPEGLAVGVGFGAVGKSASATFQSARNLAIGIGIQNFPEGLAVSLPLRGAGFSTWKSFWYGQLSGMVEPLAGVLGAWAVALAEPLLPYALGFAAGAMVYVVMDDIIPELASWSSMLGFVVMMSLDVGLG